MSEVNEAAPAAYLFGRKHPAVQAMRPLLKNAPLSRSAVSGASPQWISGPPQGGSQASDRQGAALARRHALGRALHLVAFSW
ncbi:MAG TPA: hypothetical protein VMK12_26490 [Anaeromyxobacteraceae bacterium]|nr:hypothetical protein [Anaeromyxobacteraceae bacterium]